jgi:hypothetical protein
MKITKLNANAISIEQNGAITLISYTTAVAQITNYEKGNEPIIQVLQGQPQSKTTAKHLNAFFKLHIGVENYKKVNYETVEKI